MVRLISDLDDPVGQFIASLLGAGKMRGEERAEVADRMRERFAEAACPGVRGKLSNRLVPDVLTDFRVNAGIGQNLDAAGEGGKVKEEAATRRGRKEPYATRNT